MRYQLIYRQNNWLIWLLSLIIVIILQIIPCKNPINLFWPSWLNLLLIYGIMVQPNRINVGIVFLISIIVDVILGSILGIHALLITITIYIIIVYFRSFGNKNIYQQTIIIIIASVIAKLIVNIINYFIINALWQTEILYSGIVDGIVWPLLLCIMRKIQR